MSSIEISIKLNFKEFPILQSFKKKDLDKICMEIFRAGYKIHFPSKDEKLANIEFEELKSSIDSLRNEVIETDIIDKINAKIEPLNNSLEKLLGLQTASSKKGELAENIIEHSFLTRYGDIKYEKKNTVAHSGDAWIYLPDNQIIMIESKNYLTTINKDEVAKLEYDMKFNHIRYALFISLNASIQGFRDMDFHTFYHNGEPYFVITMANLSNDVNKLDLGYSMIRKLMNFYKNNNQFPWVEKNIKDNLNEINEIITKNYLLRDNYFKMEKSIIDSMEIYYKQLRDYQYELDNKIKKITKDINDTVSESLYTPPLSNQHYIENHKTKKIFPVIVHLIDIFDKNKYILKDMGKNKYDIYDKTSVIGNLEIQMKKVILNINKNEELILIFKAECPKENNTNLKTLEKALEKNN
jgi:hypothetical protein